MPVQPFSHLTAIERAAALVDAGSLTLLPGSDAGGTSLSTARGRIDGRETLLILTDGHQRGGTIGMAEARQFGQALGAAERRRSRVVVCWDTGGVRVQEGPAALAATSAVGVALAQLGMRRVPVIHVICGPRGCFGAPAVIAASGHATLMTSDALWGLTGPQLLEPADGVATAARDVMSAAARRRSGDVAAVVADSGVAIRRAIVRLFDDPPAQTAPRRVLDTCLHSTAELAARLPAASNPVAAERPRRRDFFAYSFRGQWRPDGWSMRTRHVHAAWGELSGSRAMAIIVGPERSTEGIGVAAAHAVVQAVRTAVSGARGTPAPIITFLFCRGHASTVDDERAGLPRALAACLRSLVAARQLGHPLLCVLGGGAYGAAYLALAAPSDRILAIRGTAIAPMAPRVLAAFQRLRGIRAAPDTPPDLARMFPDIRIVESVVRLPRALADELAIARRIAQSRRARRPPAR
jgi:malonate decarboxylase beta subunit